MTPRKALAHYLTARPGYYRRDQTQQPVYLHRLWDGQRLWQRYRHGSGPWTRYQDLNCRKPFAVMSNMVAYRGWAEATPAEVAVAEAGGWPDLKTTRREQLP